jgi:hypothetical protein
VTEGTPPVDAVRIAWHALGDARTVIEQREVSANVSTNHVYRLALHDGSAVIAKTSSYGSYFLFREDHDRLHRCSDLLSGTRFEGLLADVLVKDGRAFTWYDGTIWVAFYLEVERLGTLPRILETRQIDCFASEIALFHRECDRIAPHVPLTSKTIKSDAIALLDELSQPFATQQFGLEQPLVDVLRRHTHEFLLALDAADYDYVRKLPVLIDWNLGNFSVADQPDGSFRLATRWDYDWFRIDTRVLDFYFLSRVSSSTGDRTVWTYSPHTLVEPRFLEFLEFYEREFPLESEERALIPETYRFFILHYVVREGARFFRSDLCTRFRREAATIYLPAFERLDFSPLRRSGSR